MFSAQNHDQGRRFTIRTEFQAIWEIFGEFEMFRIRKSSNHVFETMNQHFA